MSSAVDVLVVAFGSDADVQSCLAALRGEFPVTVVDNASSASCRAVVTAGGATYVDAGRNLGFAGGVNLGLAMLKDSGSAVLLLNPDARIDPEAVRSLHKSLCSTPRRAGVAPRLVDDDGVAQRVCWRFPSPSGVWLDAVGLDRVRLRWDFLIGAVLLLRTEALTDVGSFDERYFLYAEEADWQRRARDRGWTFAYCDAVTARHRGGGASTDESKRVAQFYCGQETFIRKWHGAQGWWLSRAGGLVAGLLRVVRRDPDLRRRALAQVQVYLAGPCKALRDSTSPLR